MQIDCINSILHLKTKETKLSIENGELTVNTEKINMPGEYEIQGVHIRAFRGDYLILSENVPILYLSQLKNSLKDTDLDEASQADLVLLRVEDINESFKKELNEIISKIDPRMLILVIGNEDLAGQFSQDFSAEKVNELKLSSADLPDEGRKTFILLCQKKN